MAESKVLQIKNLDKFNKALEIAPAMLAKELKDAMAISIAEIHREAIPRTPLDTGKLRQSYREQITKLKGVLSNHLVYAMRQHEEPFSHPRGGERYYLKNAVKAKTKNVEKNFEQAVENVWKFVVIKTKI